MNAIRTATATAPAPSPAGTFSAADEAFFRLTASLFAPSFVFGAGVLLSTYDDEVDVPMTTPSSTVRRGAGTASAPTSAAA